MASAKRRASESDDGNPAKVARQAPEQRKATFTAYLLALNQQFTSWVQEQEKQSAGELWVDGCRDYIEHAEQLVRDFKDVLEEAAEKPGGAAGVTAPTPAPAPTPSVSFGGTSTFGAVPAHSPNGFPLFGGSGAAIEEKKDSKPAAGGLGGGGELLGLSAPSASSAFSFGGAPSTTTATTAASNAAATAPSTAPSSFFSMPSSSAPAPGAAASAPSSLFGQAGAAHFSFGQGGAGFGGFAFGGASASAPAEEEPEEPQKYESEVVANDEAGTIMFKAKAKMSHYKKGGLERRTVKDAAGLETTKEEAVGASWDSKGVGMLMVRVHEDGGAKPFITFTTEAGRVLYIANMSKDMKLILNDSANLASWSAPWSPDGKAPPSLQMVRFQLAKGKHKELHAEVLKLQEQMP